METRTSNTTMWVTIAVIVVAIVAAAALFNNRNDKAMMNDDTMTATTTNSGAMMQNDTTKTNTTVTTNTTTNSGQTGVMVGGALMIPSRDIVDNAVLASNVTTLVSAVQAAGLVDTLKSKGPFTVFAPSNAAFDKLPKDLLAMLMKPENKARLTSILTYHVVPGRYTSATLKDGQVLKTVLGQTIKIAKSTDGHISVNGTAQVETKDVISSNGVTFVIDSVLMPNLPTMK